MPIQTTSSASVLSGPFETTKDFIEADEALRDDPEAWEFIDVLAVPEGSTGPELRVLYESFSKQWNEDDMDIKKL